MEMQFGQRCDDFLDQLEVYRKQTLRTMAVNGHLAKWRAFRLLHHKIQLLKCATSQKQTNKLKTKLDGLWWQMIDQYATTPLWICAKSAFLENMFCDLDDLTLWIW